MTGWVAGCSLTDPEYVLGTSRQELQQGRGGGTHDTEEPKHLWVSAVEYPEGYDWQRDTAHGRVSCRLVLLRDGERKLELPIREGVSPDPDMHHILGGHLYTEDCTASETLICRDGEELFRYAGREMIRGWLSGEEGTLHTIGQNRSGNGFSYRIQGEMKYAQPAGTVFGSPGSGPLRSGALYRDGKSVCFAYATTGGHYLLWRNGDEEEIFPQEPLRVFDLRSVGGRSVAVYSTREDGLRLIAGEADYVPASLLALNARILPDGQGSFVLAVRYRDHDGYMQDAAVGEDGLRERFGGYGDRVELVPGMETDSFVALDAQGRVAVISWQGRADHPEAGRWRLMGPGCIRMDETDAWVALTGPPPQAPAVWHNGELTTLLMNGYLTEIAYE